MKINWTKVWDEFAKWCELSDRTCKHCGSTTREYPEWDRQRRKIQNLVKKHTTAS